jgi:hypothetical protein
MPQMSARDGLDAYERLKDKKLDDKILKLMRLSCDQALRDEQIILSRVERARFVQLVSRDLLLEIPARL